MSFEFVLRLIGKWLNAGLLEGEQITYPEKDTLQGGVISPLLSNIFLYHVLDDWFVRDVQPRMKGRCFLIRFADDFVIGFEKGLSYWKQFLKDGGYIALTESTWFTDEPSSEVLQFWQGCYPDIKSIPDTEKVIMAVGYDLIDHFKLPASTWYDD